MRVRQLQIHLQEQGLIQQSNMKYLQGMKIGVDAAFWLRSIQKLKDPFADAVGGIPPGLFGMLQKELEYFQRWRIVPVFIFEGIVLPLQNQALQLTTIHQQLDNAWLHLSKNNRAEAQKVFAVSTSRINADVEHIVFHYLKSHGYEVARAPYFVGAQLAHLAESGFIQGVVGPPGMLLYGVPRMILLLDFSKSMFEWTELEQCLQSCGLTREQFVDACLLAGTEYSLTYPYLNFDYDTTQPGNFQFEIALEFIRQMPLINWMQVFPTEDMRLDHIHGYCVSKVLLESTPVLHTKDLCIRPLHDDCPRDFSTLVGVKLPAKLYMLLCSGALSRPLPAVIARCKWVDRESPLIDSQEYRQLVLDLGEYRAKALGLLLQWTQKDRNFTAVSSEVYWERAPIEPRTIEPVIQTTVKWNFTREEIAAEKKRQGNDTVDLGFCLRWHAHLAEEEGYVHTRFGTIGPDTPARDKGLIAGMDVVLVLTNFLLLEMLELIGEDGDMTVLGDVLKDCKPEYQETCLFALELMKFGVLTEQPFEEVSDRKFPPAINYPKGTHVDSKVRSVYLIARVMSLRPMKLLNTMWSAHVDFDLAAFHSHVRILKRTLRELCEASFCNILLQDFSHAASLPPNLFSPSDNSSADGPKALLPTFMLPRTCMGVVWKHVLMMEGKQHTAETLRKYLRSQFPCVHDPVDDLRKSLVFWEEVHRCVTSIAEPLGAMDFKECMDAANQMLQEKRAQLGL